MNAIPLSGRRVASSPAQPSAPAVITGQTGVDPIFGGGADFDLELIESRTLDGNVLELIYRPSLHV